MIYNFGSIYIGSATQMASNALITINDMLINRSVLYNFGIITIPLLNDFFGGVIYSYGRINNTALINNHGTLENLGTIRNRGTINSRLGVFRIAMRAFSTRMSMP